MLSIVKLIKWNAVIVKQLRPTLRYQKLCMSSTGAKSAIKTVCRPEDESVDQEKTEPSGWKHHVQASSEPLTVNKDSKIVTHKTAIKSYQTHYGNDELEPFSAVLNWRKEDSPVHLRLAKQDVAEQIAREIRLHRKEHVPLLEINPGIGLLSKELVANGERKIRLIEQECSFADHMLKWSEKHNCHYKLFNPMLLQLSAYFNDIKNAEVYSEVLGWMQNNDRQNDVDYQAFMATGNDRFLRLLLFAMTYQMTWFEHIRGEFFLVLPETNNLFIKKEVNRIVCLFQMYFEYEVLCEVDRRAFLPWWQTPKGKQNMQQKHYLVKLAPRRNLFSLCPVEHLPGLTFFVRQSVWSQTVVDYLEQWIPGCSAQVILAQTAPHDAPSYLNSKEGIRLKSEPLSNNSNLDYLNIFTKFKELNTSQLLTIFRIFRSLPDYSLSSFESSIPAPFQEAQLESRKRKR